MFITDKLTEIAIAICNEFRHWVWVFPHHSFDLLDFLIYLKIPFLFIFF